MRTATSKRARAAGHGERRTIMQMSTQFTVAIQTLLLVAIGADRKVTSERISQSTGGNPVMIRQLFGKLKEAGILQVSAGRGGARLARDAREITLWDVYAAVEGTCDIEEELFRFHPKISEGCQIGRFFKGILIGHLEDAADAMRRELDAVTIAQLIDEWRAVNAERDVARPPAASHTSCSKSAPSGQV